MEQGYHGQISLPDAIRFLEEIDSARQQRWQDVSDWYAMQQKNPR